MGMSPEGAMTGMALQMAASGVQTGIQISQNVQAAQQAKDQAQEALNRGRSVAAIRARDASLRIRRLLAEQSGAAASGPTALMGATAQVSQAQSVRDVLSQLRRENLQTLSSARETSNNLRLASGMFQTRAITGGLAGASQLVGGMQRMGDLVGQSTKPPGGRPHIGYQSKSHGYTSGPIPTFQGN